MSGGSVPYHLRTNKAIERKIFFDLLRSLSLSRDLKEYKYFSLGGPMLADHQVLHHELGLTKLFSIERDSSVITRQEFNKPFKCIDCLESSTHDFISNFSEEDPVIIWLDYTDTKWGAQLTECQNLLSNLKEYDLFKVTFNANPDALKGDSVKNPLEIFRERANCSQLSGNLSLNDVAMMEKLSLTLSEMFDRVTQDAFAGDDLIFKPLMQFRYIDNRHQMLTITGIVLSDNDSANSLEKLLRESYLTEWPYFSCDWGNIQEINVPDITMKERSEINKHLPLETENFDLDSLPFKLDRNDRKAKVKINNYLKYYRFIPNFQRVIG